MATNGGLIQLGAEGNRALTNIWKVTGEHLTGTLDIEGWNAGNYPTRTPTAPRNYQSGCYVWAPNIKPGNLVLKWDGMATWNANGQNFGSTTVSGGRKVLTPASFLAYPNQNPTKFGQSGNTSILFKITGVGSTPPSNIRLCHADDEADMDAGQVFNDEWLTTVSRLKPGIIRWLDNPSGSHCFAASTSHEAAESDNKWIGSKYVPTDFVDSVSYNSSTQTFTCAKSGFVLTNGVGVHVRIPTRPASKIYFLNVEGTGAKPVRPYTGHEPSYGPGDQMTPRTGAIVTFIYNSLFDAWIVGPDGCSGSDGTPSNGGYEVGIPLSVKVALCNTIGCDLWWNPPLMACDPYITSYFTSVFTYLRDNLNPGLKVYVEGPNECWNYAKWGFASTFFMSWAESARINDTSTNGMTTRVRKNGVATDALEQAYGRLLSKMGETLETVYGPQNKGVKYELICGMKTSGGEYQNSAKVLAQNFVAENPTNNKPPINYITGFCMANYYNSSRYTNNGAGGNANPNWQGWPNILYYSELYWNNFADPNQGYTAQELTNRRNAQLRAVRYVNDGHTITTSYQTGTSYGEGFIPFMKTRHDYLWNRWAKPLYFYEGGNSPDWFTTDITVNYQGLDPEGVLRPATTGLQLNSGYKFASYLRASKYDPKLRWIEFRKLKQLTNLGHSAYPARYFQTGDGAAWASYDPDVATVRYLTGQTYTASADVWRYPNLAGPCESTKGFEDFSNGRFVMYAKTA